MLTFLTTSIIFAQLPEELLKMTQKTNVFESYIGSVYTTKEYEKANIIAENSGTFNAPIRYNIFNDAIEYTDGSNLYEIMKSPTT